MKKLQLAIIALGVSGLLAAQERGPGREGGFGRPSPLWTVLDADHDGAISNAEIANAPAALRSLDQNHDGKLTLDEVRPQMPGGRGPERGERREGPEGGAA